MARRQRLTREQGMRIATHAAWRRFGHEHHMWFIVGPYVRPLLVLAAATAVLVYLWMKVPHLWLGTAAIVTAVALTFGWLAWTGSGSALQRRMSARASGGAGRGLGWAVALIVVLLSGTAWLALWSPYA